MMNLTLKQLRYFDAVARTGHFGQAAAECAISQPALSMQIKELEQSVGIVLFERTHRQVRLTGFGQVFWDRAQTILRSVEELSDLARASRGPMSGRLRLGVIPTVAPYLLPQLIGHVSKQYPDLDLYLRESITPRLIQDLTEGRLDAAIVALPVSEASLEEVALFSENFVLVRSRSEADLPVPSKENLRDMRLLLLEEGHCFRDQALSFCDMTAQKPKEMLEGSTLSTLVQMVGAGMGVTLIPDMAVTIETRSAPVAISRFSDPQPSRTIGMVWRRRTPLVNQIKAVADIMKREF